MNVDAALLWPTLPGSQQPDDPTDSWREIRHALRQALAETLARMAQEPTMDRLLAQMLRDPAFEIERHVGSFPASSRLQEGTRCEEPFARRLPLSPREHEILTRIAAGYSNKQIARQLGLSLHTVKRHVANILGKLGVTSRLQAATWLLARQ